MVFGQKIRSSNFKIIIVKLHIYKILTSRLDSESNMNHLSMSAGYHSIKNPLFDWYENCVICKKHE